MSTYKDAFAITDGDSDQRLQQAADLVVSGASVVVFNNILALRSAKQDLYCEVIDPLPQSHQCANEYAVMVENVRRRFEASKLAGMLPDLPRKWLVVEDNETGMTEVWRAP